MSNTVTISIAMTTYNGSQFIIEQLESLRNQTRPADQVIICDDCSSDDTVSKVKRFIEEHVLQDSWEVYKNPQNLGYVENFLSAAQKCAGNLIFFSDQDDIWDLRKLEIIENIFIKHQPSAVVSNYQLIDENGKPHVTLYSLYKNFPRLRTLYRFTPTSYLRLLSSSGKAVGFRRELLPELLKHVKKNALTYDTPIGALALFHNGFMRINAPLVKFRIHSTNTSAPSTKLSRRASDSDRLIASVLHILKMHEFVLDVYGAKLSKKEARRLEKSIELQQSNMNALEQNTIDLQFIKNNLTWNPVVNKAFSLVLVYHAVKRLLRRES